MSHMDDQRAAVKVLNDLVQQYYTVDSQIKAITPLRETLNRSIKDLMKDMRLSIHVADHIVATCKTQSKTTLNKEKVLQKIRESGLPDDFLNDCWEVSEVQVLVVKKV